MGGRWKIVHTQWVVGVETANASWCSQPCVPFNLFSEWCSKNLSATKHIYICVYYIATGREEVRIVANTILSFLGTQLVNWARLKFSQLWCLHQRRLGSALLLFLGGLLLQLGLDGCLVTTSWCWHFFRNRKIFRTCLNLKQEIQQVQETFP